MKFKITRDWLARRLEHADDSTAAAGGTSLGELEKEAQRRTVTPAVLAEVPTEIGRVLRFVREQRGWTRSTLAELADVDETEIAALETEIEHEPSPRTVIYLADALGFSRTRFQELVGHVTPRSGSSIGVTRLRFAAHSKASGPVPDEQFEAIRALVDVLSTK
jgi:transcriptional regulator with XRE-family HTH domain